MVPVIIIEQFQNIHDLEVKSEGILFLVSHQLWKRFGKDNVVQKRFTKGVNFYGSIAGFIIKEFVFYGPCKLVCAQGK